MGVDRRARGHAVEVAARELLRRAGLTELAVNANYRGGELDLVMQDATRPGTPSVVFVEVRYRQSQAFGGGAASVDIGKRRRLVHAAHRFLQDHPALADAPCRFDVVDARGDPASPRLEWIRDAFRADEV
ncbi:MAG: YraN family protein [Xanthomonas sp.]|uniref:YraN family protein n=1 Tax=Pseudoxanthomonas mexicana TaxID=128785 RepID=UPI000783DE62|nr:YraN family protein [Pseudoxanthomonas mexicana]MBA3929575.1 YraN family protein [Xanthomonas sp.]